MTRGKDRVRRPVQDVGDVASNVCFRLSFSLVQKICSGSKYDTERNNNNAHSTSEQNICSGDMSYMTWAARAAAFLRSKRFAPSREDTGTDRNIVPASSLPWSCARKP